MLSVIRKVVYQCQEEQHSMATNVYMIMMIRYIINGRLYRLEYMRTYWLLDGVVCSYNINKLLDYDDLKLI